MCGQHDYSTNLLNLTEPTKPYLSWVSMGVEFSGHPDLGMTAEVFGVAGRAWSTGGPGLAVLLMNQGKHAQAQPLLEEAVAIMKLRLCYAQARIVGQGGPSEFPPENKKRL